jgi:hypothetical protein
MTLAEPELIATLRATHEQRVLRNDVEVATQWGQPCHAVNIQLPFASATTASLQRLQDELAGVEPALLRCPRDSLHVSVDWLLPVHTAYDTPWRRLLDEYQSGWLSALADITEALPAIALHFKWVVGTAAAVIAVAEPSEPLQQLRRTLRTELMHPPPTRPVADIVHTTLFRYRSGLRAPRGLLTQAARPRPPLTACMDTLVLVEELSYPSLTTRRLGTFSLVRRPAPPSGLT